MSSFLGAVGIFFRQKCPAPREKIVLYAYVQPIENSASKPLWDIG